MILYYFIPVLSFIRYLKSCAADLGYFFKSLTCCYFKQQRSLIPCLIKQCDTRYLKSCAADLGYFFKVSDLLLLQTATIVDILFN